MTNRAYIVTQQPVVKFALAITVESAGFEYFHSSGNL